MLFEKVSKSVSWLLLKLIGVRSHLTWSPNNETNQILWPINAEIHAKSYTVAVTVHILHIKALEKYVLH